MGRCWRGPCLTTLLLACIGAALPAPAREPLPVVRIGVLSDASSVGLAQLRGRIATELETLLEGEFELQMHETRTLGDDTSLAAAGQELDRLLADPQVDLVLVLGPVTAWVASRRSNFTKPVVAPLAVDAEVEGYPHRDGASGVANFNYVAIPAPTLRDVKVFREIVRFTRLGVVIPAALQEALPHLAARALDPIEALGIELIMIPAADTVAATLAAIPPEVEAVYVLPLIHFDDDAIRQLAAGLVRRKLPSFSYLGRREVEQGLLAAMRTDAFLQRLARRVALNIQRIVLGEDAGTIPVAFAERPRLSLNLRTARAIGIYPTWDTISEAELLYEDEVEGLEPLNLEQAVTIALENNLELAAMVHQEAAGRQNVAQARAGLRPQLSASLTGAGIDSDRAAASFGSQAERSISAALGLEQALLVEPAAANVTVQEQLQRRLELEAEQLRRDVIRSAAIAFLDVLRAQAGYSVQRDNLRVTRSNLELAQLRQRIGASGASEVYRWESAIATRRRELASTRELVNVAKIELNRVLNRPLATPFASEEVDLSNPGLATSDPRLFAYVYNPRSFATYIELMVEEGIARSPEVRQLDAAIAAAERSLASARRTLYLPQVGLSAQLSQRLHEGGAGSEGGLPLPFELPQADDTDWSIGLSASLPLYAGGANIAAREQAREELYRLRTERRQVAERVEQRIRTALRLASVSYYAIELSRSAAEASTKSLDLVTDAYARGAVSITELLDAQNAALAATEAASNAVYDFLIDLMEVDRATCLSGFLLGREERYELFRRLDAFFAERGVEVRTDMQAMPGSPGPVRNEEHGHE